MRQAFAILLALLALAPASVAAQDAYDVDEHGHPFRVEFDRYNRLELSAAWSGTDAGSGSSLSAAYRTAFSLDFPDEEIWWRLRHELGGLTFQNGTNGWVGRVSLVHADYLRHDVSSWILIPFGEQDVRLPGPFDIVVRWELLALTTRLAALDAVEKWEVSEFDILLDFIRDANYRHRLAIGVTADYEIERGVHELTPLSGATLLYAWERSDGLFAVEAELGYARLVELSAQSAPEWHNLGRASASAEWTVAAIVDQPLALFAQGDLVERSDEDLSWSVLLGAKFSFEGEE